LTPDESFIQTLAAARRGEDRAWADLYRDLSPGVLGYLRARGAAEPEDVLGEVFVGVVRDLASFDGDKRNFRAWVFTLAHHRLLDEHRYRDRRPVEPAGHDVLERRGPRGDVEEDAQHRLARDRVTAVLGRLSADQQSVLLLRVLGGLTVEEVGRVIGKRPGAVKALQRRGLAAVERDLTEARNPLAAAGAYRGDAPLSQT
jgi:RNA polymerase sigma-70 factor, ECF subfamily